MVHRPDCCPVAFDQSRSIGLRGGTADVGAATPGAAAATAGAAAKGIGVRVKGGGGGRGLD